MNIKLADLKTEYNTETYQDDRDKAIKQISIKNKIEICTDNNLLTDELLNNLIYGSDVTLDDLINVYGLPF